MNPAWVAAIVAGVGLLVNGIWTAVNMQMRADLKEWIGREFVSDQVCRLRMAGEFRGSPTYEHDG